MTSGIYGVVEGVEGADVYVRIGEKTKIRAQRSAIAALDGAGDGSKT